VFRRKIGLGPGVDLMQARRELQELERKFHNKLHSMRSTSFCPVSENVIGYDELFIQTQMKDLEMPEQSSQRSFK
jgi:hypothetical protein